MLSTTANVIRYRNFHTVMLWKLTVYVQVEMSSGTQGTLKTIFNKIILSYCFVKTYNPFYLVSKLELVNKQG